MIKVRIENEETGKKFDFKGEYILGIIESDDGTVIEIGCGVATKRVIIHLKHLIRSVKNLIKKQQS